MHAEHTGERVSAMSCEKQAGRAADPTGAVGAATIQLITCSSNKLLPPCGHNSHNQDLHKHGLFMARHAMQQLRKEWPDLDSSRFRLTTALCSCRPARQGCSIAAALLAV